VQYINDMQTAVFCLLLTSTCMVLAGVYFEIQGINM
jgi:hypothetical protein